MTLTELAEWTTSIEKCGRICARKKSAKSSPQTVVLFYSCKNSPLKLVCPPPSHLHLSLLNVDISWGSIFSHNNNLRYFLFMLFVDVTQHFCNTVTKSTLIYFPYTNNFSQTWVNDQLWITTTFLWRPPLWGSSDSLNCVNELWTTANHQQRPHFLGPKGGRYTQVWLCCKTCVQRPNLYLKMVIVIEKVATVDRWLLFGGHLYI